MVMLKIKNTKKLVLYSMVAVLLVGSLSVYLGPGLSRAESIDELRNKSKTLEGQIKENEGVADAHAHEANTLQGKIQQLDGQIGEVNRQISSTTTELKSLEQQLIDAKAEIERQKGLLKASVRALYKRSGASTVELLVGSDNFTDFFNQQAYLEKLKAGIQDSTEKVIEIEKQIQAQKEQQKELLGQQKVQKDALGNIRAERDRVLAVTKGKEANYRKLVDAQQAELAKTEADLEAQIAAEIAAAAAARAAAGGDAGSNSGYGFVARGQKIGRVGSTGYSTGPHIHFQVKHNSTTYNPSAGGKSIIRGYMWPVYGGAGYISQSYGCVAPAGYYYTSCNGGRNSFHAGLDIAASWGTSIVAVADGHIVFRGWRGGLGYVVVIDHGGGWTTWYPHQAAP